MRAILLSDGALTIQETRPPALKANHVRIRVDAVGVNRADLIQKKGFYPPPEGVRDDILGLEYAGVVIEKSEAGSLWSVGDRVMGIAAGETYAQQVVMHEREVLPVPAGLSMEEAAAIPEAFLTAYDALTQLGLVLGQRLLVHGIGSGVGLAALQLANQQGIAVVGTSRTREKLEAISGLAQSIWVQDGHFSTSLSGKVDAIIDFIGGAYLEQNLRALKTGGSMIVLGVLGGRKASINLGMLLVKRLNIFGSTLRSRPLEAKIELAQRFSQRILPLFESRALRPQVDRVYEWTAVDAAHAYMESNQNTGKIVLKVSHDPSDFACV